MEWLLANGGNAENIPDYDCIGSQRRPGITHYTLGAACIIYGLIAEIIYVLDLMVMVRKQYRRLSCYKIMIVLGIYDMAAISLNSLLTGYFWIVGANYCTNPTFMFASGNLALGLWCGACMICFVLVINRLLDLSNRRLMQLLFKDGRTYIVLLIPIVYSIYFCFFTSPIIFNSDQTAWFFFTFVPGHDSEKFLNYPHTANNLFVVVLTCLLDIQYSRALVQLSKIGHGLSWGQKSFFVQCSTICAANLIAALIYVYMQFFPTPSYSVLIGHICWQLGHGFPAIVYLLLNRTIQREVLTLLGLRSRTAVASISRMSVTKTMMITDS